MAADSLYLPDPAAALNQDTWGNAFLVRSRSHILWCCDTDSCVVLIGELGSARCRVAGAYQLPRRTDDIAARGLLRR
jgi:hypothetical protein